MSGRKFSPSWYVHVVAVVFALAAVTFLMAKPGVGDWLTQAKTATPQGADRSVKEKAYARMLEISGLLQRIGERGAQGENSDNKLRREHERLRIEYEMLAARFGNLPIEGKDTEVEVGAYRQVVAAAPPGCTLTTLPTATNSTPVAIPPTAPPNVVTSTITIAGAQTFLYDVNVVTNITHTNSADLDITLTSPAGTVVTLTTDNGGVNDNVFAGTTWDDNADPDGIPTATFMLNANQVQTHPYANLTLATPLTPEEPLAAFIGEDPNGIWTITISDDANANGGSLNSWSLNLTTLASAPSTTAVPTASNTTPIPISPVGMSVITSPITITTSGTSIFKVKVTTNITHSFTDDLQFTVTSPAGTIVTFSSGIWATGAGSDDVYAGTTWDDDANPAGQVPYTTNSGLSSDHPYADLTVVPLLAPVEALGAFIGENPNGTWTLTIADQFDEDGGALNSWSLDITTAACAAPCTITCPANITISNDPNQCGAVVNYPAPTTTGACATVTCSPASGSFFPVGATTTTCTASGGPSCTFTISVVDTQPPGITCPANATVVGGGTGAVVIFPAPAASDNCPGVTVTCAPPSGSTFPPGTTTVSCTATDASANTATCSFTVTAFDLCLQDSGNPSRVLLINSSTGQYRFCCAGTIYSGTGTVTKKGNTVTLEHNSSDRRVTGKSVGGGKGTGSLQFPPGTTICTISDSTSGDGTCACP